MDEMEVSGGSAAGGRYRGEPIAVDHAACRAHQGPIGVTTRVSVVDANSIKRSLCKAKRIVDKPPEGLKERLHGTALVRPITT